MTITLLAHHIVWDTEGDNDIENSLPSKLTVEVDLQEAEGWTDINSQISDQLSDHTGYCVFDYQLEGFSPEADFALQMTLRDEE